MEDSSLRYIVKWRLVASFLWISTKHNKFHSRLGRRLHVKKYCSSKIWIRQHKRPLCLRDRLGDSTYLGFIPGLKMANFQANQLPHNDCYNSPNTMPTTKCFRGYHNLCTKFLLHHTKPHCATYSTSGPPHNTVVAIWQGWDGVT